MIRHLTIFCLCVPTFLLFSNSSVSAAEILVENQGARVVTGERPASLTRGFVETPKAADIDLPALTMLLDSVDAALTSGEVAAIREGLRTNGWAQRETEPVGNSDHVKVQVHATAESLTVRRLDVRDRVEAAAVMDLSSGATRVEHLELEPVLDRTVYAGLAGPEFWIMRQEHLQKQFFESIMDLNYPGLEAAKEAYENDKLSLALYEVAEYFRRKTEPAALLRRPAENPESRTDAAAERIVDHVFGGQGFTVQMGERIDWQTHPKEAPAAEWLWNLNGHHHFLTLLRGYLTTANEKYAREYVDEITDFIIRNPAPPYTLTRISTWRNLEAGDRGAITWPRAFYGFLSSASFTPQAIQLVLTGMWSHGNYIYHHPAGLRRPSNWSIVDSSGLCGVALYFPEFSESETWRSTAFDRLTYQLQLQVYSDGAQYELSTAYHRKCLHQFQRAMDLAEDTGNDLPDDFARIVESMYEYLMWLAKPDGSQPAVSDSRPSSLRGTLRQGAHRFGRDDLLYVATGGEEGQRPDGTSRLLPDAGYAVMRSDWGPDARYLFFDGGPVGSGHQHEDKLSILLSAFGVDFLVDTGPHTYTANKWRLHCVSSAAHSTVLVDGKGQTRIDTGIEHYAGETPVPFWETTPERDYVVAQYDAGYGEEQIPVVHRRHVVFQKPEYWVVVDELSGDGVHEIESLFQFAPDLEVSSDGSGTVTARSQEGPSLTIVAAQTDGWVDSIVTGQETPRLLGWYAPHSDAVPAPVAVYRTRAELPLVQTYLLYPSEQAITTPLHVRTRRENDTLVVDVQREGTTDEFVFHVFADGE